MTPFRAPTVPSKPVFSHTQLGTSLRVDSAGIVTCNPRAGAIVVLVLSIHTSLATVALLSVGVLSLLGIIPGAYLWLLGFGVALGTLFAAVHLGLRRFWSYRTVTFVPAEHAFYTRGRMIPFSAVAGVSVTRDLLSRDSRSLLHGPLQWLTVRLHDGTELRLCKAFRAHVPPLLQALGATGLPLQPAPQAQAHR